MRTLLALGLLTLAACDRGGAPPAPAAHDNGHAAPAATPAATDPAAKGYQDAMARMHADMGTATGDADEMFVRMMIPHHQSAIDMAEIELRYGKDEATRALAREVIDAQAREIAQMRSWLEARGASAPAAATAQ